MIRFHIYTACMFLAFPRFAGADEIAFRWGFRNTTDEEISDGAPPFFQVIELFASTDGDIVALDSVRVQAEDLYQHPFGSDSAPPNPNFVSVFPALRADSFITTPGDTIIEGGGFTNGGPDGDDTFRDTTDDGPQAGFRVAQLTTSSGFNLGVCISGQIIIQSIDRPGETYSERFSLIAPLSYGYNCVPEPSGMLLGALAGTGLLLLRTHD